MESDVENRSNTTLQEIDEELAGLVRYVENLRQEFKTHADRVTDDDAGILNVICHAFTDDVFEKLTCLDDDIGKEDPRLPGYIRLGRGIVRPLLSATELAEQLTANMNHIARIAERSLPLFEELLDQLPDDDEEV